MKKFFEIFGVICLMCFSFLYTEKTVSVVKEHDDIMIALEKVMDQYKEDGIDAEINGDTIIPGIHGTEIDVNKSYSKMRRFGKFNESLLVKKDTKPNVSIEDHKDKFVISGNPTKNQVAFLFLTTKDTDISTILSVLKNKNVSSTFFIDFYFYDASKLEEIASYGHEIGNLSLNYNYNDSSFGWLTTKIKKVVDTTYCYDDSFNTDTLLLCSSQNLYTIKPSIITETRPLLEVKKQVKNGSIIAFHVNDLLNQELGPLITYLKSKNFEIVSLKELLKE